MLYILKSQKTYNKSPEMSYGNGTTMQFKEGLFIFDTEKTNQNYWERDDQIEIDSERFRINKKLIFTNPTKAEIIFLKLKLEEMEKNSFMFFMPSTYERYEYKFKKLIETHPEYAI